MKRGVAVVATKLGNKSHNITTGGPGTQLIIWLGCRPTAVTLVSRIAKKPDRVIFDDAKIGENRMTHYRAAEGLK